MNIPDQGGLRLICRYRREMKVGILIPSGYFGWVWFQLKEKR